ncbi:MAG: hypothetical protein GF418_10595 [Chitinivibrionales bacterium]|nr:hypothetical protein [Chitinivibrionales bacterium]MBD3396062.1 hypothetical protein [Chitinivibrionales bacterium]
MKPKRDQNGMTLVEVLVSGTIGAIVAGGILTILTAQNSALKEGTANSRLLMHSIAVSTLIGREVRAGDLVLQPGETWSASPSGLSEVETDEIYIYDENGTFTKAYRISGGNLQESDDASSWSNFTAGAHAVTVDAGSGFTLPENRRTLTIDFELTTTHRGTTYTTLLQGDLHRCRS